MGLTESQMPCSSLTPMGWLEAFDNGFATEELKASCPLDNTLPLPNDASTFLQPAEGSWLSKENISKDISVSPQCL